MSLGVPVTSLRNGFYASRGDAAGRAVETGELAAPEDGPVAWTSHDDLAEVADIALTDPTGPALDGLTLAHMIGRKPVPLRKVLEEALTPGR